MRQTQEWVCQNAPTMLATLDDALRCHDMSWGWREHLGLTASGTPEFALTDMVALDDESGLPEQIKNVACKGTVLHEIPVTLRAPSGTSRGLLYAWPALYGNEAARTSVRGSQTLKPRKRS